MQQILNTDEIQCKQLNDKAKTFLQLIFYLLHKVIIYFTYFTKSQRKSQYDKILSCKQTVYKCLVITRKIYDIHIAKKQLLVKCSHRLPNPYGIKILLNVRSFKY